MANSPSLTPWTYLKQARLRAGYGSPTAAAAALGIGVSHYCSIEKGRRGMGALTLVRAAEVFGVDIVELEASQPDRPVRSNRTDAKAAA